MVSRSDNFLDAALALHKQGLHVFPADHPDQPKCIGLHDPAKSPCDGKRGKHPSVKFATWAVAATPQMIDLAWSRRGGLANIAVACGPSNIVVLDEDEYGELDRWCADYGITLPDTYTVTTARGRHLYFYWDHSTQRIGNCEKAMSGYKINVRGHGGFAIAEGSRHESGATYIGNGQPIADLSQEVAQLLLAGAPQSSSQSFFGHVPRDPNATIPGRPAPAVTAARVATARLAATAARAAPAARTPMPPATPVPAARRHGRHRRHRRHRRQGRHPRRPKWPQRRQRRQRCGWR